MDRKSTILLQFYPYFSLQNQYHFLRLKMIFSHNKILTNVL